MRRWLYALLVLLALPASAQELPSVHLRVVGGLGETIQFKNYEEPFWTKRLAKDSGGQITAEVTPYDQDGLGGSELLQMTRLGAITIGNVPLAQIASEDPEAAGLDLAGLNGDIAVLRRSVDAYRSTLANLYRERYSLELLAIWTNPAQVVFCNHPITGLADLRGLKIRVASAMHADFVTGLGATAITTPYKGLMHALRNKVADCAITAAMSGYRIGLHTVTTHVDPVTVSWGPNILIANHAAWHRLGQPVRDFLQRELDQLSDEIWQAVDRESTVGIACVTGNGPCPEGPPGSLKFVPVTNADREIERKILDGVVLPNWAERCGTECVANWNRTIGRLFDITITAGG